MSAKKRAYTNEEKQVREEKIVHVAWMLLTEKGYYNINMAEVADAAGLAKGTLYRYFNTKEELFLSVLEQQFTGWFNEIENALELLDTPARHEAIVNILVKSFEDKSQLTQLLALKHILLEHNITFERAQQNIIWLHDSMEELEQVIADKLNLQAQQGKILLKWMLIFIIGLEGMAHPARISQEVYEKETQLQAINFSSELHSFLMTMIQALQAQ